MYTEAPTTGLSWNVNSAEPGDCLLVPAAWIADLAYRARLRS